MNTQVIKVKKSAKTKGKLQNGKTSRKRKRTSSGLIEKSDTMKGTETEFEEFVIDRTVTPQRKLEVRDIERTEEETEKLSDWRKSLESSLLGSTEQPATEKRAVVRVKRTCFNCAGEHNLRDCPRPKNFQRISKNKRELEKKETPRRFNQDSVGLSKQKTNDFKPGEISDTLRAALGLNPNDIPEHIYRMRRLGFLKGYPPGWLRKAIKRTDSLKIFTADEPQKVRDEDSMKPPELDISKIVRYPGFNGTDKSLNDAECFKIPPAEVFHSVYQQELTEIFKKQRKAEKKKEKNNQNRGNHKKFANDDDDDDDVIIIDGKNGEKNKAEFRTPGEDIVVTILNGRTNEDNAALMTPLRTVEKGRSLFKVIGTPTFVHKNVTPVVSLEAFADGIQPFRAGAEDVQSTGVFRKLMERLKEVRALPQEPIESELDADIEVISQCGPSSKLPDVEVISKTGKKLKNKKRAKKLV